MLLASHHNVIPASGPPVVLLHGFASSSSEDFVEPGWVQDLHAAGRTVLAIDLPGHGNSPAITTQEEATATSVITAILETVNHFDPNEHFDLIGYSLGARLAWDIPQHTARVRRMVLGGLSPHEPFASITKEALHAALTQPDTGETLATIMADIISAPGRDTNSLSRLIPGLGSDPFSPSKSSPNTPTLLAAGDADPLTNGVEELLNTLSDGSLISVPGDHRGALDSPQFRTAAIHFLNKGIL